MKVFSDGSAILKEWVGDDRIAKRVYVGESMSCPLVGRPWKRLIDSLNEKKKRFGYWASKEDCI